MINKIIIGTVVGLVLFSVVLFAIAARQVDGPVQVLDVPSQAPARLTVKTRDGSIKIYPSDRFEIKYNFYLYGVKGVDSKKAEQIFSQFSVQYSDGVLIGNIPSLRSGFTGAGITYQIGLTPGVELSIELEDGNVDIRNVAFKGLKVHAEDGNIKLTNNRISSRLDVELQDGNIGIHRSLSKNKDEISLEDGNVTIDVAKDWDGRASLDKHGDGNFRFYGNGCKTDSHGIVCGKGLSELHISIQDGNVTVNR